VGRIREISAEKHCKPSQLALAWVMAQGKDIVPIFGTKRRSYLEENLPALTLELSEADLKQINEIAPHGVASGEGYRQAMMGLLNR
jgi:aryl-alcohol dehydrogenase-like predicted oxidoreductase